jgi:hypothetical protein
MHLASRLNPADPTRQVDGAERGSATEETSMCGIIGIIAKETVAPGLSRAPPRRISRYDSAGIATRSYSTAH